MVRLYREWLRQREEARTAGGRPLVVVVTGYDRLPDVDLVVRNFTQAPAKEVSFEFSAPVEDPDGTILSELPYLKEGLPFLVPGASIIRPWGHLRDLAPLLREKGLEAGIGVTVRYKDLAGKRYESEWRLHPLLFEGAGIENSKGVDDLVDAVQGVHEKVTGCRNGWLTAQSSNEN